MKYPSLLAALIALAGLPAVFAQSPALTYIPNSSVKLYQVNGDCDWVEWDATITAKSPACKPTTSKTLTNADILGDDVPVVFENNGEMIVTFGDTIGSAGYGAWSDVTNSFLWQAHDPIARSTTANASDGLLLNFFLSGNHGLEVQPPPQPNGTPAQPGQLGTPPPVSPEPVMLVFGIGLPHASNIYLSIVPSSEFWTGLDPNGNSATRYFAGASNGQPIWSSSESAAVPIVNDINPLNPTITDLTAFYSQQLGLWLMTFNGGQTASTSRTRRRPGDRGALPKQSSIHAATRDSEISCFITTRPKPITIAPLPCPPVSPPLRTPRDQPVPPSATRRKTTPPPPAASPTPPA